MRLDELMRFAGRFFESERIDYYVFGATAMNFWVPPRNTVDLDVVVCEGKRKAVAMIEKLRKQRFPVTKTLAGSLLGGRIIRLPAGDAELDLKMARSRHEREALARSKLFRADDYTLRIASPEDLVLFKLHSWRRQDQADIERVLTQRPDFDVKLIESQLPALEEEAGLPMRDRWKEIRTAP
jgi:hypothetical protein